MSIFNLFKKTKPSYELEPEDKVLDYETPESYAKNYPRQYPMTDYAEIEDGVLFMQDCQQYLLKEHVKKIIFTDSEFPQGFRLIDLSKNQDKSVMGYNHYVNGDLWLVVSTGQPGKGIKANPRSNYMFSEFHSLREIDINNVYDTTPIRWMMRGFSAMGKIEEIDLSDWKMPNIENLEGFLCNNDYLTTVKWWKTESPNIFQISRMFINDSSLEFADLSWIKSTKLKETKKIFKKCSRLKSANLGDLGNNCPKFTAVSNFEDCGRITVLSTTNPLLKEDFLNPNDGAIRSKEYQEKLLKTPLERKIVNPTEWYVPEYEWEDYRRVAKKPKLPENLRR